MATKNDIPTEDQKKILQKHGLPHYLWTVMNDFGHDLMVRHRITGEVRLIRK